MYVILGATGQVGSRVLKTLQEIEPSARARIVTRRKPDQLVDGIEWRAADAAHDVDALASAMQEATAVFVMNPVPPDAENVYDDAAKISSTIAAAVEKAGRPRTVALSSQGAHLQEGTGVITALHDFEQALRSTGAPLTCVRSTFFMESWLPFAAAAMETGQWWAMRDPPDMQDSAVSARDVGAVIAECLLDEASPAIVNVTGARKYSENEAAQIFASLCGRNIEVVSVPAAERAYVLEGAGLGESYAAALAEMYGALDQGRVPFQAAPDTRYGTTPLEEVLRTMVAHTPG